MHVYLMHVCGRVGMHLFSAPEPPIHPSVSLHGSDDVHAYSNKAARLCAAYLMTPPQQQLECIECFVRDVCIQSLFRLTNAIAPEPSADVVLRCN